MKKILSLITMLMCVAGVSAVDFKFNGNAQGLSYSPEFVVESAGDDSDSKDYTTIPEEGTVESLSKITITFTNAFSADIVSGNENATTVTDAEGNSVAANTQISWGEGLNQLVVEMTPITTAGTYTVTIPAGAITIDDAPTTKDYTFTYTIGEGGGGTGTTLDFATLTPAAGSALEMVPNFVMTFTQPEMVGYGVWQINDLDADAETANLYTGQIKKQTDGSWIAKCYFEIAMLEGHNYEFVASVYASEDDFNYNMDNPLAILKANYTGATKAYEYAEAHYLSATPENMSTIVTYAQNEVVVALDAPVATLEAEVNRGMAGSVDCTVTPNFDNTEWTITIPESVLAYATGSFNIIVVAKDAEGRVVKGNEGEDANSIYNLTYMCYLGAPEFTVTPASGSTVESIQTVVASYASGINISGSCSEPIRIVKGQTVVAEITEDAIVVGDLVGEEYTSASFTLPAAITEEGNYTIIYPTAFFMLGNQYESCCNKEQIVDLVIEAKTPVTPPVVEKPTITPAEGTVTSLQKFTLTFAADAFVGFEGMILPTLTNANGEEVATITLDYDWDAFNVGVMNLDKEITEPGTYTLTIPAGTFVLDEEGNVPCEAYTFTFVIEASTAISAINADTKANIFTVAGQRVNKNVKGVNIINGKKYLKK